MRVLILDTYYQSFLDETYARRADFSALAYEDQWRALMDQCFATADFYSSNLQPLGVEATEIVANADRLQAQWAKENAPRLALTSSFARIPKLRGRWRTAVVKAQIIRYAPDVLYVQDANWASESFLDWAKEHTKLLVAQHATTLQRLRLLGRFDLVISTIPEVVDRCRREGLSSEYLRLGFGQQVLERVEPQPLEYDVVHVGGYGAIHTERNHALEEIARAVPSLAFWGTGIDHLAPGSPIRDRFRGPAWGINMYRVRAASRMTLTKHITSVVGPDAANQTMYETTGIGSCLVVDDKRNLGDLFERDREVISYRSPAEAAEKISYLLEHEDERAAIATAGQNRTLREHTYKRRMEELRDILHRHL